MNALKLKDVGVERFYIVIAAWGHSSRSKGQRNFGDIG